MCVPYRFQLAGKVHRKFTQQGKGIIFGHDISNEMEEAQKNKCQGVVQMGMDLEKRTRVLKIEGNAAAVTACRSVSSLMSPNLRAKMLTKCIPEAAVTAAIRGEQAHAPPLLHELFLSLWYCICHLAHISS